MAAVVLEEASTREDQIQIGSTVTRGIIWGVFLSSKIYAKAL